MRIISEFREFATRGNVMDMAVGVIMGGAFGKIVSSIVSDVIMPPIGLLIGGVNFTDLQISLKEAYVDAAGHAIPAVTLNYGKFFQTTFDFLVISFSVFVLVKAINRIHRLKDIVGVGSGSGSEPEPEPTREEVLLAEIRDILKKQANGIHSVPEDEGLQKPG